MKVLELVVNDLHALACYRVIECAVGDLPDILLMPLVIEEFLTEPYSERNPRKSSDFSP